MSRLRTAPGDAAAVVGRSRSWERRLWRHPEWWSVALSAVAWLLLVVRAVGGNGPTAAHLHSASAVTAAGSAGAVASAWLTATLDWSLMVVAMMLPLVVGAIRTTAARSLWRRRDRAVGGFLLGYLGPWLFVGLVAFGLAAALGLSDRLHRPDLAALGFAVAAVWQLTTAKGRALTACHRTAPLAPRGWRADRDCLSYGWSIGCRCLVSCWALMVACLLAGHGPTAMACASVVAAAERYLPGHDQRVAFAALAGLALLYAVAATI